MYCAFVGSLVPVLLVRCRHSRASYLTCVCVWGGGGRRSTVDDRAM